MDWDNDHTGAARATHQVPTEHCSPKPHFTADHLLSIIDSQCLWIETHSHSLASFCPFSGLILDHKLKCK